VPKLLKSIFSHNFPYTRKTGSENVTNTIREKNAIVPETETWWTEMTEKHEIKNENSNTLVLLTYQNQSVAFTYLL